jgi:hypothetical protein
MSLDAGLDVPLRIINIGLEHFAHDLETAGVPVVHVDWRPPAGDADMASLLSQLDDE